MESKKKKASSNPQPQNPPKSKKKGTAVQQTPSGKNKKKGSQNPQQAAQTPKSDPKNTPQYYGYIPKPGQNLLPPTSVSSAALPNSGGASKYVPKDDHSTQQPLPEFVAKTPLVSTSNTKKAGKGKGNTEYVPKTSQEPSYVPKLEDNGALTTTSQIHLESKRLLESESKQITANSIETKPLAPTIDIYKDSFRRFLSLYMQTDSFVELAQQLTSFARYSSVLFAALAPAEVNRIGKEPRIDKICEEFHQENLDKLFEIPQRWLNFFLAFESVNGPVELWRGILDSIKALRPELLGLSKEQAFKLPKSADDKEYPTSKFGDRLNALGMQGWWAIPTPVLNHFLAVFNVLPLRSDFDPDPICLRVEQMFSRETTPTPETILRAAKIVSYFQLHSSMSYKRLKQIGVSLITNDQVTDLPMFLQGAPLDLVKDVLNTMDASTHQGIFTSLLKKFNLEVKDIPTAHTTFGFLALRIFINEEGWMKAEERLLGVQPTSNEQHNPDSGMRFLSFVLLRMRMNIEAASVCSRYDLPMLRLSKDEIMKTGAANPNLLLEQDTFGPCRLIPKEERFKYLSLAHFGLTREHVQFVTEIGDAFRLCREKILASDKISITYEEYGEVYDFRWSKIAIIQIAVSGFVAIFDFVALKDSQEFYDFCKELIEVPDKRVGILGKMSFTSVLRASFKEQPLDFKNVIFVLGSQNGQNTGLNKQVLDTFGTEWDSSNKTSNWKRRPLRESQLHDAALKAQIALSMLDKTPVKNGRELEVLVQNKELLNECLDELGKPKIFLDTTFLSIKDHLLKFSLDIEDFSFESEQEGDPISQAQEQKRIIVTGSRQLYDRPNKVPMILIQGEESDAQTSQLCKLLGLNAPSKAPKEDKIEAGTKKTPTAPQTGRKNKRGEEKEKEPTNVEQDREQLIEKLKKALVCMMQSNQADSMLPKEVEDYAFTCNRMFWKQEHQVSSEKFRKAVVEGCLEVYNSHLKELLLLPTCWVRLFGLKAQTAGFYRNALLQSIKQFLKSMETNPTDHGLLIDEMKSQGLQQWKLVPIDYLEPFIRLFLLPKLTESEKEQIKSELLTMVVSPNSSISSAESSRLPTYIRIFDAYQLMSKTHIQRILERFIENNQMDEYLSFLPDDLELAKKTGAKLEPFHHKSALRELRQRFKFTVRDFPKSYLIHCKQFIKYLVKDKGWMIAEEKFCTAQSTSKDPTNPDSGMRFLVDTLSKSKGTRAAAISICMRHQLKMSQFKKLCDLPTPDQPLRNVLLEDDDFAPSSAKGTQGGLLTYITLEDFGFKEHDVILVDKVDETFHQTVRHFLSSPCVGVDGEFWSDTYGIDHPTIATLQLATETKVAIFDFVQLNGSTELYDFCKQLFEDPNIEIVGHTFQSDIAVLRASFKEQPLDFRNVINVENLIQIDGKKVGLAKLVSAVFKKELCKMNQCSNWAKRPLRRAQLHYGALDAVVTLNLLLKVRKDMQILNELNGDQLLVLNKKLLVSKSKSKSSLLFVVDKSLAPLGAELTRLGLLTVSLLPNCTLLQACKFLETVQGVFLTTNPFILSLTTEVTVLKFSTDDLQKQLKQLTKYVYLDDGAITSEEEIEKKDEQPEPSEGEDADENSQGGNIEEMMA